MLSNDAAGACICDVNSAVAGSPDRPGATPPRTLSDYFTVNSPRGARAPAAAPFHAHRVLVRPLRGGVRFYARLLRGGTTTGRVSRERIAKEIGIRSRRYSRRRNRVTRYAKIVALRNARTREGKKKDQSHWPPVGLRMLDQYFRSTRSSETFSHVVHKA